MSNLKTGKPSTGKLISISTGLSDDEDFQLINKKRRIVHHSGRPENNILDEDGSGDYYDDELYYSESDASYPTDYSDTTDPTDTELIIEETQYNKNTFSQNSNKNKIDEINFDEEYEGRRKGINLIDDPNNNFIHGDTIKYSKTNGADHSFPRVNVYLFVSTLTMLFSCLQWSYTIFVIHKYFNESQFKLSSMSYLKE